MDFLTKFTMPKVTIPKLPWWQWVNIGLCAAVALAYIIFASSGIRFR